MKFYCDECKKFIEIYLSDPIPTTHDIEVMYSIFCKDHHYICRVDSDIADVLEEMAVE